MVFPISDAVTQTLYLEIALAVLFVVGLKKKPATWVVTPEVSTLLKGFAILAIIFAHIGYYLVSDTRFLFPLSIVAGVGVNLFLFLSGYGLVMSARKNPLSVVMFYKKRLLRLYVPLWIVLALLLISDALFLHLTYPIKTIIYSFLGFFPKANLYADINSPLWYFTFILGYYLVFPLIFSRRVRLLSSFAVMLIGYLIVTRLTPVRIDEGVLGLYRLHVLAFPLGMLVADVTEVLLGHQKILTAVWAKGAMVPPLVRRALRYMCIALAAYLTGHFLIHSGVGKGLKIEQMLSLITMGCVILIALLLKISNRVLLYVGTYSYEVYLLHWPLLYRYSPLYTWLPPAVATMISLALLMLLAMLLQKGAGRSIDRIAPSFSKNT